MVSSVFDQTIPWRNRVAKLLALATLVAAIAFYQDDRKKKQLTPAGTENTPAGVSPRGRLFLGEEDGKEIFMRVSKYPFFNLTAFGKSLIDGEWETSAELLTDQFGTLGSFAKIGLLSVGYKTKYDQFKPVPVILGENLSTFVPGFRVLDDVSRMFDPFARKQNTFSQTFTRLVPTTDSDLQEKLHGDIRTRKVPLEGDVKRQKGDSATRTTTDVTLKNYWQDILLSSLTGVYRTRIDPKEAEAFVIREQKNASDSKATGVISVYVEKYKKEGNNSISVKWEMERELVKEVLGEPPYSKDQIERKKNLIAKFHKEIK